LRRFTTCDLCGLALGIGFVTRRFVSWAFVLCVVVQFGGCVTSSPVSEAAAEPQPQSKQEAQPQTRPRDARLARLYFLCEKLLYEIPIKIEDKAVGSVCPGSYFSVDRPPGRYRIAAVNALTPNFESEIQIEGGRTYYFGVGTIQMGPPVQNFLNQALGGSSGQQMRSTSLMGSLSAAALYQIDAAEGPAVISQLKPL
jgi:hypothetical protein